MLRARPAFHPLVLSMIALFRLLARVPLPLMHRLGIGLGWLVWCCAPAYRRRFRANAEGAGFAWAQYRPAIGAAGAMAAELPWLWLRPHGESVLPRVLRWEGTEAVEAALEARQGVIFMTPHLGCWEMCGQAVAERYYGRHGPLTALFRPARKKWMAELIAAGSRDRPGLRMLPTSIAGVRGLIRTLRNGGYTGILPDQVPPLGQGVWAPFLGRPAYTMTLLPRLAQTGARVFTSVCERLPRGAGYVIRFEPVEGTALTDPQASVEAAATAMNEGIERLIRRLPGQYVWDYARYKQPRGEAPAAPPPGTAAAGEPTP
jgi:KDO2-lipid IV(A) lauroyltransferase